MLGAEIVQKITTLGSSDLASQNSCTLIDGSRLYIFGHMKHKSFTYHVDDEDMTSGEYRRMRRSRIGRRRRVLNRNRRGERARETGKVNGKPSAQGKGKGKAKSNANSTGQRKGKGKGKGKAKEKAKGKKKAKGKASF